VTAVDHQHGREIEGVLVPGVVLPLINQAVFELPLAVRLLGERVLPGGVEVIDMEGHRDDPVAVDAHRLQSAEQLFGLRAGVSPLRRVKLDEDLFLRDARGPARGGGGDERDRRRRQDDHRQEPLFRVRHDPESVLLVA